jgi:hypothetical protein
MQFITIWGAKRRIPKVNKYLIDWEKPSRSILQKNAKDFLYSYWKNHAVFEEFPVAGTKMTLDFYNATKKIAVEVQGRQHHKYVPYFHGKRKMGYLNQVKRDLDKKKYCEMNDVLLVEILEGDNLTKDLFKKLGMDI